MTNDSLSDSQNKFDALIFEYIFTLIQICKFTLMKKNMIWLWQNRTNADSLCGLPPEYNNLLKH